jgi:threonine aldolase
MTTAVRTIDLRSDTVTLPTPAMREAMANAELGDDLLGDDPTTKRLEAMAAERMGKEAGLFVASGTMGNLVSILAHCQRSEEAIAGHMAHVLQSELGGAAGLAGVQIRTAHNDERGRFDLDEVRSLIRHGETSSPRTALICLENTHNFANGAALPASYTAEVAAIAREAGAQLHIDGARIFNAAIALETTPAELAKEARSVTFCLSKGLSCPVGSLICADGEFIARARRLRRMVGGGMRQSGVLAAAGIVALEEMVDRLADDHANARLLAEGLVKFPQLKIDPALAQTNILFATPVGIAGPELAAALKERGVLTSMALGRLRFVTHYGIERGDIEQALDITSEAIASLAS